MGAYIGMALALMFWGAIAYLIIRWIIDELIDRSDRKFKEKVERYPRDIH